MKKYILPVIALALLAGCGKVSDSKVEEKPINIVSGTVESNTKKNTTTGTEASSEKTSMTSTTKLAGNKISGTTAVNTKNAVVKPAVTRASGGSGGTYGTTRPVPTAPKTTTTAAQTTALPTFDPKDYSSVSFGFDASDSGKINVLRQYSDGKSRSYQVLSADTTHIQEALAKDNSKSINDFVVRFDYDFDGYPDLFIIEKDELNKEGKYYHYDPENGSYMPWSDLNSLRLEIKKDDSSERLVTCDKKEDKIEYEEKIFEWNSQKQLVLREYKHQYTDSDGEILIEYVSCDENGTEISRETRDSSGNLIGGGNSDN